MPWKKIIHGLRALCAVAIVVLCAYWAAGMAFVLFIGALFAVGGLIGMIAEHHHRKAHPHE